MRGNWKSSTWVTFGACLLSACGPLQYGLEPPAPVPQGYPFDEVKVIAPDLRQNDDPASFQLETIDVSPTRRVLLRFSGLRSHISQVIIWDGMKVEASIGLEGEPREETVLMALILCPLSRNWMMRATWDRAHPFSREGVWTRPGGDFDEASCLKVSRVKDGKAYFDVTTWFENGPKGLGRNLGFVLCASAPITIYGDRSSLSPPRVEWMERRQL